MMHFTAYAFLSFLFLMIPRLSRSTLFPYTTLFRSGCQWTKRTCDGHVGDPSPFPECAACGAGTMWPAAPTISDVGPAKNPDRKSTRLNSSHANISYAVFCLKKQK